MFSKEKQEIYKTNFQSVLSKEKQVIYKTKFQLSLSHNAGNILAIGLARRILGVFKLLLARPDRDLDNLAFDMLPQ